jgi:hypothetical protein
VIPLKMKVRRGQLDVSVIIITAIPKSIEMLA